MSTLSAPSHLTMPVERLGRLCDAGTLELLIPAERRGGRLTVTAGLGRVGEHPVVCYAQDATVSGGSIGAAEAALIVAALQHGRKERMPVVAFLESAGARLQEGTSALGGFGRIFYENVALSGLVPQISVITGTSAGGGCYSPALTDLVVMVQSASMFLTGPKIVRHALGEEVDAFELGGAQVHGRNGVCDFVVPDDHAAAALVRELLSYLPRSAGEPLPRRPSEPPGQQDVGAVPPRASRSYYDVRDVISRIVDGGGFLEVSSRWAKNIVVGFARLEGQPIGIVANQARSMGGIIDTEASQKGARFVRLCDAFGLPLLVLVDTPGFMPGTRQERAGVIRHGASLVRAFAAATVPRVTVIVRKAFGGAFIAMNSKDLGADACLSWPDAEIGIMAARSAVEIIHRRTLEAADDEAGSRDLLAQEYTEEHLSPSAALRRGVVDAVIAPSETRERVAQILVD